MPDQLNDSAETQRLLMRIREGEREAFNELFARYRDRLRKAVELRLDPQLKARIDASDIVQEAQMQAYRRLDDYLAREPMPFGLWLRKTAQQHLYNQRRNHVEAMKRTVRCEQALPEQSSLLIAQQFLQRGMSASKRFTKAEQRRVVIEAVANLVDLDREILLMRNVEGLSHREIAHVLGMNYDSVRKRYGRALLKLEQLLAERGISESDL